MEDKEEKVKNRIGAKIKGFNGPIVVVLL